MSNNVPVIFFYHITSPKRHVSPKFPQIPHPLAFRKIKPCSTSPSNSFQTNNLFVGQRNFLWYNPFCTKKYVRSKHALLKALTRPFLGFVINPKYRWPRDVSLKPLTHLCSGSSNIVEPKSVKGFVLS